MVKCLGKNRIFRGLVGVRPGEDVEAPMPWILSILSRRMALVARVTGEIARLVIPDLMFPQSEGIPLACCGGQPEASVP